MNKYGLMLGDSGGNAHRRALLGNSDWHDPGHNENIALDVCICLLRVHNLGIYSSAKDSEYKVLPECSDILL